MNSVLLGLFLLLVSLLCLGTWPALLRLNIRRHPCHNFIDYAGMYVLVSFIPIIITISVNNMSTDDEQHDYTQWPLIIVACVGGVLLATGNACTQWSTAVYRAPLTTVLALQASMTVMLGTTMNYFLQPQRTSSL